MKIKDPYLALEASAGSGKTFALSVRYVALILSGANPKSITALTFTKKAANEMSSRIVDTFLNLSTKSRSSELDAVCEILNIKDTNEVLALRDKAQDEFLSSNLKIMTFDSFFALILRLFSLNLGLSPDYKNSSEVAEILNANFIKEVAKEPELLNLLAYYIIYFSKSKGSFFNTLDTFYENFDELDLSSKEPPNDTKVMSVVSWFKEKISNNQNSSKDAINAFDVKSVDELLQKPFLSRESLDYRTFSKIYTDEFDEKFAKLKLELKEYVINLEQYKIYQMCKFLKIYKKARFDLNVKLNELSFSDVTKLVARLLSSTDKDMLYFRLDGTITHLLIDEFQDTNVTQYNIIRPLIKEIVSGHGQNGIGSFFYVGDTKQSIYRFRGGKKELFNKLREDFSHIDTQSLEYNYRSAKILVEYVNSVFKTKIDGYATQKPTLKDGKEREGYLEIFASDEIVLECVKKVEWLIKNGVCADDISILCWKNDDIRAICDALSAKNINARDEGGMLLRNSPCVFALVNYTKFCLFKDEIYRQNAAAYVDTKLSMVEIDFSKTAKETLFYLAKKAGMSLQNLDILKLFEIASQSPSISDFIFDFENSDASIAKDNVSGVRVMTVHKSKGLEFKHVILCDKISRGANDTEPFLYEYDIQHGWQICQKVPNREYFDDNYAKLKEHSKELDDEEELNKLYVAMTRAKNSLIIVKRLTPDGKNPSYFSKYLLKNGSKTGVLELDCLKSGVVVKSEVNSDKKSAQKMINLVSVPRDKSVDKTENSDKNLQAIYFGTALHYLLEMSTEFNEPSISKAWTLMCNKFAKFLDKDSLDDIKNRALSLIKDSKFGSILNGARVYKEQILMFENEQKQLDLLCVKDDEVVVIDYKSSDFSIESNITQVKEYVQILGKIFPDKKISGVIFYILRDRISSIDI
ncbi:RecB-like helicase [Campylobacter mucosalis]|uniref:DNA 3'-5' helicase n=1 Tax=Campylobacter mucosalis CCUG 21559 TaxID=1032067 RepID=A0A6G5QFY3_9BACT|nr:RecB-like helicase [Campylobacter mucosalis]QCD44561.1 exonuclease V, helicase AddA [Campylobacter mucosalis CCUG 21559]